MTSRSRARRLAVLALALTTAVLPATAHAAGGQRGSGEQRGSGQGSVDGQNITVQTKVRTTTDGDAGTAKTGTLSSADSNWTPPACWYEPAFSPKEIEANVEKWRKIKFLGIGGFIAGMLDAYYKDGDPYKDYNLDKQGQGMFWAAAVNPNRKDDPEASACDKMPFWVDNGETPKEPLALTPKILAEYAYDELPIPSTEIRMKPTGTSTVNLPSWIWLDRARFKKISVTASLPGTGLSATATAEPVSLHLEPGTADATVFPGSGECAINKDGSIGEPYTDGKAGRTPPCGVMYERSTGSSGAYQLKATVTWKISWTSTTGEGGALPSGTFGTTQAVTVQEIQSINR